MYKSIYILAPPYPQGILRPVCVLEPGIQYMPETIDGTESYIYFLLFVVCYTYTSKVKFSL